MQLNRITIDPARMNGQPCVRALRITVRRVIELLAIVRIKLHRQIFAIERAVPVAEFA